MLERNFKINISKIKCHHHYFLEVEIFGIMYSQAIFSALLKYGDTMISLTGTPYDSLQEMITEEGFMRCLPCHFAKDGGVDGFFIAKLKKEK